MRIMAVDYGDARTGVAVSDELATLAGEAWVIHEKNQKALVRAVADEVASRGIGRIVVGYPRNMDGTAGSRAVKCEQFAESLRAELSGLQPNGEMSGLQRSAEVVLWDERLTTMSAHRILSDTGKYGKKRKESVDAVAASLILEGYLRYLNK